MTLVRVRDPWRTEIGFRQSKAWCRPASPELRHAFLPWVEAGNGWRSRLPPTCDLFDVRVHAVPVQVEAPFPRDVIMLRWAFAFLILALVAGLFGFGGLSAASAGIAKTLFMVFVVFAVIALIVGLVTGRRIVP